MKIWKKRKNRGKKRLVNRRLRPQKEKRKGKKRNKMRKRGRSETKKNKKKRRKCLKKRCGKRKRNKKNKNRGKGKRRKFRFRMGSRTTHLNEGTTTGSTGSTVQTADKKIDAKNSSSSRWKTIRIN